MAAGYAGTREGLILVSAAPASLSASSSASSPASRRDDLAAFLKGRRARLAPQEVGLPSTTRRRTPGLRREEVALLAGVGITWYTWLEQGRDIQVSAPVLERIARALRLGEAERTHLFMLAQNRPPPLAVRALPEVTPAHRRLLESLAGPAYLATPRWDVVAWNSALSAVFGDLSDVSAERRNMLWLVFASADHRAAIPDWEADARGMVARFRLEFGRRRDDRDFLALIEELRGVSPEFHRWWAEQDVARRPLATKRFHAPKVGTMAFEQTNFVADETADLRLTVYTPLDTRTARLVERLRRSWEKRRLTSR